MTVQDEQLDEARREFAKISSSLLSSYAALSERAEHVEQELVRTNEELEAILDALPTGVVVRDANGAIQRVNTAALRILGASAGELLGETDHEILAGASATDEPREVRRADGTRLVVSSRYSDVEHAGGPESQGSVEILDDRTEVAELTERLHRMDKVTALATMAGGIAHEIRNPLNAVQGFATLLQRELDEGSKAHHWSGLIVEGALEANAIVSSILCLARPEQLMLESIEADELLEDAVKASIPHENAERWTVTSSSNAPNFHGDRIKLRQAIRNLIANAIDVQPNGGSVDAALTHEDGEIVVRVADSGPGIPADIRGNITDPFFTTRAEGTGLGLALVSTIVQAHGGRLEISPEPSRLGGAELTLRFPLSPVNA